MTFTVIMFRLCKGTNDADKFNNTPINLNKTDENYNKQKWIHLVAVRDPIERFVASFNRLCSKQAEKSICGNCGSNFSCFLNEQYEKAMMFAKDPKSIKSTSINKEFFPQNWYVFLCYLLFLYFLTTQYYNSTIAQKTVKTKF